uniref:Potassium channel domain-containing protein n=1 Tax=Setaria digitata TaxID=48799 RepID=A0A915PH83_9BILA
MVSLVSAYAVFGAFIMSHLETYQVDQVMIEQNTFSYNNIIPTSSHSSFLTPVYDNNWRRPLDHTRQCISGVIKNLLLKSGCSSHIFKRLSSRYFKHCFHLKIISNLTSDLGQKATSSNYVTSRIQTSTFQDTETRAWPFADSLLFAFALITTIGYGNITPKTFAGQVFCIFFAAFGVPLTLLLIADLGKFISQIIFTCNDRFNAEIKRFWQRYSLRNRFKMLISKHKSNAYLNGNANGGLLYEENYLLDSDQRNKDEKQSEESKTNISEMSDSDEQSNRTMALLILFIIYVIAGSLLLSTYEPEMPFFTAIYFNFITLTSIGLGDIVPQRRTFMAITILYITVGLAFTTIAIEIAADTLRKLHYFRRKIKNVGNIEIWFGGKRLTVRQIIRNLCDQFNVPDAAMTNLNIGNFIDQAIKVEAGELPPLRSRSPKNKIDYDVENEPEPASECGQKSESVPDSEPCLLDLPAEEEEIPNVPELPEFTASQSIPVTPEPESYSSKLSEDEIPDVPELPEFTIREPTPVIPELEPIPDPEPDLLELSHEAEEIPYAPEVSAFSIPELTSLPEPKPPTPPEPVPTTPEPVPAPPEVKEEPEQALSIEPADEEIEDAPTIDLEALRRKGYSEEALKRYLRYQNEWNKFRTLSRKAPKGKKKTSTTKPPPSNISH